MDKLLEEYKRVKNEYKMLKRQMSARTGGAKEDLVLLAGYAGTGKSTVAHKFQQKGYHLISTDEVIRNILIPMFKGKIEGHRLFNVQLYKDKHADNKVWVKARETFLDILKEMVEKGMEKYGKVVVEGQMRIPEAISHVFRG